MSDSELVERIVMEIGKISAGKVTTQNYLSYS